LFLKRVGRDSCGVFVAVLDEVLDYLVGAMLVAVSIAGEASWYPSESVVTAGSLSWMAFCASMKCVLKACQVLSSSDGFWLAIFGGRLQIW
jgi:hypothetical protein